MASWRVEHVEQRHFAVGARVCLLGPSSHVIEVFGGGEACKGDTKDSHLAWFRAKVALGGQSHDMRRWLSGREGSSEERISAGLGMITF